ncbi:MAG: nucleotidyltransferase domain-containing protein [Clostridiales Family XIII bacterium]|jgi:predicted nucleotidyltransferase|nr:nucleotidyltransferase domain-containing protein [Clostridiales Family XIII bacterium]
MLDQGTVINTVERYADLVASELSPAAVVLYGSYAKGNASEDSDIDVAVIFNGFKGDWLEASSYLWRLRRGISFDIEPILLDSTQDKSGFVANIFKTGQIIYQA